MQPPLAFQIIRNRNDYSPPSWIGRLLFGLDSANITKTKFVSAAAERLSLAAGRAEALWQDLCHSLATRPPCARITSTELRTALSEFIVLPDIPSEKPPQADLLLSTIHRSKGREYSNVIVVVGGGESTEMNTDEDHSDPNSESRVLFVALTRAKKDLLRMDGDTTRGMWPLENRWIRTFPGNYGARLNAIQVGVDNDIDPNSFAAGNRKAVQSAQEFLWTKVNPGTPVTLTYARRENGCPIYDIFLENKRVGSMSTNFGWALYNTIKSAQKINHARKVPHTLAGLWVRQVVTELGDLGNNSVDVSLRVTGLWLGVRLEGLAFCQNWKEL
jgi:hypothetical protein